MRVLVIGGTQFIGPPAVRELARVGHDLTVFHRGEHEADLPAEVRHVHNPAGAIPVIQFPEEVRLWMPEVVLHMFPIGEQDAQALMRAFRGVARRVVAISSGDVYRAYGVLQSAEPEPLEPMPLTEDSPLRQRLYPYRKQAKGPEDWMYHYEKILAERAILGDPEFPGTILRLPMVYGPGDPGHRFLPFLRQMKDPDSPVLLAEHYAACRFQHGYVDDVAHAIALAVSNETAAGRIYNVGVPQEPTTAEWVRRIGDKIGWKGPIVASPNDQLPAGHQVPYDARQHLVYDTTRIRRELGYTEIVSPDEALERTIAWERSRQSMASL